MTKITRQAKDSSYLVDKYNGDEFSVAIRQICDKVGLKGEWNRNEVMQISAAKGKAEIEKETTKKIV